MPRKRVVQTSGVVAPVKREKVAPATTRAALLEQFKDFAGIDVISRRFNDPNDPGSLPILLKDEDTNCCTNSDHQQKMKAGAATCPKCQRPARKWYVRYFNLAQEGRNAQMRGKGYVPVEIKELQDADDISDLFQSGKDTYVRRGDRGQEILGKQPLALFLEIKRAQRAQRTARASSAQATRQDLAEAAGRDLGDEAGQSIHDGGIKVESMRRVKTTLSEEAELGAELEGMET